MWKQIIYDIHVNSQFSAKVHASDNMWHWKNHETENDMYTHVEQGNKQ